MQRASHLVQEPYRCAAPGALEFRGDLDQQEEALCQALQQNIADGEPQVVLDLAGVTFLSEEALGVLVGALRAQQHRGGTLRIDRMSAFVRRKLMRMGLLHLFVGEAAPP